MIDFKSNFPAIWPSHHAGVQEDCTELLFKLLDNLQPKLDEMGLNELFWWNSVETDRNR